MENSAKNKKTPKDLKSAEEAQKHIETVIPDAEKDAEQTEKQSESRKNQESRDKEATGEKPES